MTAAERPKNLAASVRARLRNLARERNVEFQLVLSEFAIERFLYRLGRSSHVDRFVLKGAMLFKLWTDDRHRATWDLDLHGRGSNDSQALVDVVRDICSVPIEDGLTFDLPSISVEEIHDADEYTGARLRFQARLAEARIPVQVDVAFGDVISPAPKRVSYPVLLDHTPPSVLAYPREAVVAEKLEAMVSLGVTNSRMKDFYDIYKLAAAFDFEGRPLVNSVRSTFERRKTPIPEDRPLVLTPEFLAAHERQTQWRAFLRRGRLEGPLDAGMLVEDLWTFVGPVIVAAAHGDVLAARWVAGGPWRWRGRA